MLAKKKPCDGEDCNGKLQYIWKNVDGKRYCKQCAAKQHTQKAKPTTTTSEKKRYRIPSRSPIPKFSDKRQKENIAYSALRETFLQTHPNCMINIPGVCSRKRSNQIHHSYSGKDRDKYYLDTTTWFASEENCHEWVHNNPREARELGFLK